MVVSILMRKTTVRNAAEWRRRATQLLARLRPLLERQPGFLEIELLRGEDGRMAEVTRWRAREDCDRYVREGGAATAATISDALLPTAPYPDGTWWRETYEVVEPEGDA
jgi:heme-degrading monooxygenase HmoA